jgi:hypothetical protein
VSDIWNQVRGLEGQQLRTTKQQKIFRIAFVPGRKDVILICPESSRSSYPIDRAVFEHAVRAGLYHKTVTPDDVKRANLADWRTSYVAAILAHLSQ